MWEHLALPWQACLNEAWDAYCADCVPIGAAVVSPGGCVLATGRNRIYARRESAPEFLAGVRMAHAEINALLALEGRAANPRECLLYTSTEPCPMCAGAILMSNLRVVCFAARDPWAGATDLYQANRYMQGKHMRVEGPHELEPLLFALQTEYFLGEFQRRSTSSDPLTKLDPLLASMSALHPAAVALGRALYQEGMLRQMRAEGQPARLVFERLAALRAAV
jgi:tRNA(adenine34) deaminase